MARLKKKQAVVKKVVKQQLANPTKKINKSKASIVSVPEFSGQYTEAVGRRKVATSRVRIYHNQTGFVVNGVAFDQYFDGVPNISKLIHKPFEVTNTAGDFAVSARVSGSGISSQVDAVVHGLSRALVSHNVELKPLLKQAGLLTRDARMKETRKIGMGGKARRKRQSPKR